MGIAGIVITLLLLGTGAFIRYKNASWLISGYKSATQAERDRHDIKMLARRVSGLFFILAAICGLMTLLGYLLGDSLGKVILPGIAVLFVTIVAGILYLNGIGKRK